MGGLSCYIPRFLLKNQVLRIGWAHVFHLDPPLDRGLNNAVASFHPEIFTSFPKYLIGPGKTTWLNVFFYVKGIWQTCSHLFSSSTFWICRMEKIPSWQRSPASQPPASNHGGCGMHTWIGAMAEARWVLPCAVEDCRCGPSLKLGTPEYRVWKGHCWRGEHSNIFYLSVVYIIYLLIYFIF